MNGVGREQELANKKGKRERFNPRTQRKLFKSISSIKSISSL